MPGCRLALRPIGCSAQTFRRDGQFSWAEDNLSDRALPSFVLVRWPKQFPRRDRLALRPENSCLSERVAWGERRSWIMQLSSSSCDASVSLWSAWLSSMELGRMAWFVAGHFRFPAACLEQPGWRAPPPALQIEPATATRRARSRQMRKKGERRPESYGDSRSVRFQS